MSETAIEQDLDADMIPPGISPSAALKKLKQEEEVDLFEYMRNLSGAGSIQVSVSRTRPKLWEGKNIVGHLDTHDEAVSQEDIKEMYGGGKYLLQIKAPNSKGSWVIRKSKTISISGDPIVEGAEKAKEAPAPDAAVSAMRGVVDEYQTLLRGKRSEKPQDPAFGLLIEGLNRQVSSMQSAMSDKDRQLIDLISKPKGESSTDKILEKMLDGESARIQSIRMQHESEIRQKSENHRAEVDRIHARYDDQASRQDAAHKREVDNLQRSFDMQLNSQTLAHTSVVDGYKRETKHLERELAKATTEVAELRAKREKGPVEMAKEMAVIKEAFESVNPPAAPESDNGENKWAQAFSAIMANPVVQERLAGGGKSAPPQLAAPQGPPINVPFTGADGRTYVRKPDGSVNVIQSTKAKSADGAVDVSKRDVDLAVSFMESALQNGTEPEAFAKSAKSMIPDDILKALAAKGIDQFLSEVATLDSASPLSTQNGRNWVRKVADILTAK